MMKKTAIVSFIASFFFAFPGNAQNATLSIINQTVCQNSEVIVPMNMENFYNVGAISLFIGYDTTHLEFISLENIHPNFGGLLYNNISFPSTQIGISWTSLYGTTVTSGVFFEMKFIYKGNQTNLEFNPGCEITTSELEPIIVNYNNGLVNPIIGITMQPEDQQILIGQSAGFNIESTGGVDFRWQKCEAESNIFEDISNGETYQGATTQALQISEVKLAMNGQKIRCKVISGNCTTFSEAALLTVDGIEQEIELAAGWNSISTYIDPVDTELETLLNGIMNSLVIMITDNGFYYPDANTNTIGDFDPTKGYSLKLTNHETLNIAGIRTENSVITLPAGWSYLPVLTDCNITIPDLFVAGLEDLIIIKEIAGSSVFWPESNIYTLQVLEPGKAYLIKTTSTMQVEFPVCQ